MGEPLLNYENVMKSVDIMNAGMEIAARRIVISTVGWVPGILRMAEEKRKTKLALSLHSLDEKIRTMLMPVNKKYSLEETLRAVEQYYKKTKCRPTFEYILFDGVNDREEDIARLVKLAKKIPCKVNIIPFHSIAFTLPHGIGAALRPSSVRRMDEFVERLRKAHVTVFVRSSAGEDIDAACGQLAVKYEKTSNGKNRHAQQLAIQNFQPV